MIKGQTLEFICSKSDVTYKKKYIEMEGFIVNHIWKEPSGFYRFYCTKK